MGNKQSNEITPDGFRVTIDPDLRRARSEWEKIHGTHRAKKPPVPALQAHGAVPSNIADELNSDGNPRDWGHLESPLFKLPPEIRNKVYREIFTGSAVALVFDPPLTVDVVPATGRRSVFSTANSNHAILLTCDQIYREARFLYWATIVVRNGCGGHFDRRYFLSRIPAIVKPHIQHLRGVRVVPRDENNPLKDDLNIVPKPFAISLDEFPNLKSCFVKEEEDWRSMYIWSACNQAAARHPHVHILRKDVRFLNPVFRTADFQSDGWFNFPVRSSEIPSIVVFIVFTYCLTLTSIYHGYRSPCGITPLARRSSGPKILCTNGTLKSFTPGSSWIPCPTSSQSN